MESSHQATLYERCFKRPLDVLLALALIMALSPLMLIIGVLVLFVLGRPIFFADRRSGRGGTPFRCWKFRTMTDARDSAGKLLPDNERHTRFGDCLRWLSLDELPQLWNVIRGEMSLVGPRPLSADYLNRYSAEQSVRHHVRPGLTGWAQVNGRTSISWERKFALDVWYVRNLSFRLDAYILLLTIWKVLDLSRQAGGQRTDSEFLGSSQQQA